MRSWGRKFHSAADSPGEEGGSGGEPRAPATDVISDDGDANAVGHTSVWAGEGDERKASVKDRMRSLVPRRWAAIFSKQASEAGTNPVRILPNGTRVSPPVSPLTGRRQTCEPPGPSGRNPHGSLLADGAPGDGWSSIPQEDSVLTSIHPAEFYAEKLEVYNMKYSYLKSWPGLLRLLAGLELLFGGMVFICIIAYIQKDSEWSNAYGQYNGAYNNGYGLSGYGYRGPMTPLVLAVAGLSWVLTLVLLVLGLTMYYRTILLDSSWWPLTEASINLVLFLLSMAAGIVYLNDLSRGGLCYMSLGVNPLLSNLCRVDGGQMAGTAFIFINMAMYLGSFLVCLKMWRHEAARRERESHDARPQEDFQASIPLTALKTKNLSFRDERDTCPSQPGPGPGPEAPEGPARVHVVADYLIKYPQIRCPEERETYAAVFNDQYQEYKDLHRDVASTLSRFRQLDLVMSQLLREGGGPQEQQRIQSLLRTYQEKKSVRAQEQQPPWRMGRCLTCVCVCVRVCFTGSVFPREEGALRLPESQTESHQEQNPDV
ncbi:unnamed protein product [Tetraodon nigroviridis]|uniref:(spotted green pufferfish) hypothetical protein n=1 Tax=Tetraodon nigroviridis TaxID=99883 RepID=Q4SBN2_TETNG|nr:unnamed protein product [Tetraodon nigroviridis]